MIKLTKTPAVSWIAHHKVMVCPALCGTRQHLLNEHMSGLWWQGFWFSITSFVWKKVCWHFLSCEMKGREHHLRWHGMTIFQRISLHSETLAVTFVFSERMPWGIKNNNTTDHLGGITPDMMAVNMFTFWPMTTQLWFQHWDHTHLQSLLTEFWEVVTLLCWQTERQTRWKEYKLNYSNQLQH